MHFALVNLQKIKKEKILGKIKKRPQAHHAQSKAKKMKLLELENEPGR